jgi:hypothetical protein
LNTFNSIAAILLISLFDETFTILFIFDKLRVVISKSGSSSKPVP